MSEIFKHLRPETAFPRLPGDLFSRLKRAFAGIVHFKDDTHGGPIVEFALLAPLLAAFIVFVGMVGLQTKHWVYAQQVIRAGAAAAAADPGQVAVMQRMREVAIAKGYEISTQEGGIVYDAMRLTSTRACYCPGSPTVSWVCSTVCPNQRPVTAVYELTAIYTDSTAVRFLGILPKLLNRGMGLSDVGVRTQVILR